MDSHEHQRGSGRQRILESLLHAPEGLTMDALRDLVGLSRNAVYQHITALERDRLVEKARVSRTGGRPGQTYRLSDAGTALFPKHYDRFSDLLLELIKSTQGSRSLVTLMEQLGRSLAEEHKERLAGLDTEQRIAVVAGLMRELGYSARTDQESADAEDGGGPPQIRAYNCVYHHLAREHEEVCKLDLALLESLLGGRIEHRECMVRGGVCCRFALAGTAAGNKKTDNEKDGGKPGGNHP